MVVFVVVVVVVVGFEDVLVEDVLVVLAEVEDEAGIMTADGDSRSLVATASHDVDCWLMLDGSCQLMNVSAGPSVGVGTGDWQTEEGVPRQTRGCSPAAGRAGSACQRPHERYFGPVCIAPSPWDWHKVVELGIAPRIRTYSADAAAGRVAQSLIEDGDIPSSNVIGMNRWRKVSYESENPQAEPTHSIQ